MRFGFVLPHRQPLSFNAREVKEVARRAESLGFVDLWVSENTMDSAFSFDPIAVLSYAAAVTDGVGLGVSMAILNTHSPVRLAHQALSLDQLSGGRFILGVALGRSAHFHDFTVPADRAVRRFVESVGILRALTAPQRQPLEYDGEVFQIGHRPDEIAEHGMMAIGPYRCEPLPLWMGGVSDGAIRRAAALADGWMGNGGQSPASFASRAGRLREQLARVDRDPDTFPTSKRVFLAVRGKAADARAELSDWFARVYRRPQLVDEAGVYGDLDSVVDQLRQLQAAGANHLLLNPVTRFEEHLELLASALDLAAAA